MSAPSRASVLGPEDIPQDVPQSDTAAIAQAQGVPDSKSFLSKARDTLLGGFGFGTPTTDPEALARQAENDKIARTQFSDNIVDRYGDVLQARDRGFRDFLRDLAANEISGDRTKAQQVAQQVRESLAKGLTRDLERQKAARQEALTNMAGFTDMLKEAQNIQPKAIRVAWILDRAKLHGVELNKDVAKLIAEGGELGQLLQDPAVLDLGSEDPEAFMSLAQQAGASIASAMDLQKQLQSAKQAQEDKRKTTSEVMENVAKARTERATFHQVQANAKKAREQAKFLRKEAKAGRPPVLPRGSALKSGSGIVIPGLPGEDEQNNALNNVLSDGTVVTVK